MKEITRKYALDNGDLVITEIMQVKDEKYGDGRVHVPVHVCRWKDIVCSGKLAWKIAYSLERQKKRKSIAIAMLRGQSSMSC